MTPRARTVLMVHPGAELFGSDRMFLESVTGLREAGCRVVVALASDGPLVAELRRGGVDVRIVPMLVLRKALLKPRGWPALLGSSLTGLLAAWRLLSRVRPDTVYVSTIIIPMWPVLARLRGIRAVSHVHEAEATNGRVVNAALYLPHLVSDHVLTNSDFSVRTIRRSFASLAQRTEVVYNGIASPQHPSPPRTELTGPLRILYVGRLSPRKGPDLVIEAASRLRENDRTASVTLVGAVFEGYEWYEDQLRAQAASSGIDVEFAGFQRDIWPFLDRADVLVAPSRGDESFGNVAVEGILALRPVIASDISGLSEAARDYSTAHLVRPDDADAIAGELQSMAIQWPRIAAAAPGNRIDALRRHGPESFQRGVAAAVLVRRSTVPKALAA